MVVLSALITVKPKQQRGVLVRAAAASPFSAVRHGQCDQLHRVRRAADDASLHLYRT